MTDVIDEERYQLLRELVRAIVIGTVSHNRRQSVCIVEGTDKMVTAGLGCAIGAVRLVFQVLSEELFSVSQVVFATTGFSGERRFNAFGMGHLQCAIHLVGTDVIEPLTLIFLRQAFPIALGCLEQAQCSNHISLSKSKRIFDAAVNVTLCCQVNNTINLLLMHQLEDTVKVAYIHLDKLGVGFVFNVL